MNQRRDFKAISRLCQQRCDECIRHIAQRKRERARDTAIAILLQLPAPGIYVIFGRPWAAGALLFGALLFAVPVWVLGTRRIEHLRAWKMEWASWRDHWNHVAEICKES